MTRYRTLLADPPWKYRDSLLMSDTPRSATDQYNVMSVDDICKMTPESLGYTVAEDAFLWLWTTNPFLLNGSAVTVMRAWGFKEKQLVTWVKGRLVYDDPMGPSQEGFRPRLVCRTGMGHYTRGCTEHMVLGVRGAPKVFVKDQGVNNLYVAEEDTVFVAAAGKHSKKPAESYQLIERVTPGPYLEIYARERRRGWDSYGDQL